MDHEVVPQICDLVVELVLGPLHFYIKDKCKRDHESGGLQKGYSQAYIIHCHVPTSLVMRGAKGVILL
jgi:hypothetical protein